MVLELAQIDADAAPHRVHVPLERSAGTEGNDRDVVPGADRDDRLTPQWYAEGRQHRERQPDDRTPWL
jgi:hypothetical protein